MQSLIFKSQSQNFIIKVKSCLLILKSSLYLFLKSIEGMNIVDKILLSESKLSFLLDKLWVQLNKFFFFVVSLNLSDLKLKRWNFINQSTDFLCISKLSLIRQLIILLPFENELLICLFSLFLNFVHVLKILSELSDCFSDALSLLILSFDDISFEFLIKLVFSVKLHLQGFNLLSESFADRS